MCGERKWFADGDAVGGSVLAGVVGLVLDGGWLLAIDGCTCMHGGTSMYKLCTM